MKVELIFACDSVGGIGFEGRLPWPYFKEDMVKFQELTKREGAVSVMGRRTAEDILAAAKERGRTDEDIVERGLLAGRTSIVLSESVDEFAGATVRKTLRDVFNEYQSTDSTLCIIGGVALFVQGIAWANTVHITQIDSTYECDTKIDLPSFTKLGYIIEPGSMLRIESEELGVSAYTYRLINTKPAAITQ